MLRLALLQLLLLNGVGALAPPRLRTVGPLDSATLCGASAETQGASAETAGRQHFIRDIVQKDVEAGKHPTIVTRFPPEPNGYLHLGHAKSIALNFGLARDYGGVTHLRLDDTNPDKEHPEYGAAILEDVRWLVGDNGENPWHGEVRHASDYFEALYNCCLLLIRRGEAYVDSQSPDEMKLTKGDWNLPGSDSPYRDRTVEENLALFSDMRYGTVEKECYPVLRAKIDMASPNMNLRDPALYRVKLASHPRTGSDWRIYPMYDFAHAASDALEGITHSLCTLEFEDHRPLYDWVVDALPELRNPQWVAKALLEEQEETASLPEWVAPRQIEFSRLNLQYTLMSKRKLMRLVQEGYVEGWDDPRMPTICALRRRGVPPKAILEFCERVGISKADSNIDPELLDDCVREVLDAESPRAFAVLKPLKMIIEDWDDNVVLEAPRHPKVDMGLRELRFGRELVIEEADFYDGDQPPKGFNRLVEGGRVRLRYGYVVKCESVDRNAEGEAVLLRCSVEMDTLAGAKGSGPRVKGIIHWLNVEDAQPATVRIFGPLFDTATPTGEPEELAKVSKTTLAALVEPNLGSSKTWQFERNGYFTLDDMSNNELILNRVVGLRDTFTKKQPEPAPEPVALEELSPALSALTRLELRCGVILTAEAHETSENLWCCTVDCGEEVRQIGAALRESIPDAAGIVGKKALVLCNSKPRKLAGWESRGMLLCATTDDKVCLVSPPATAQPGDRITPIGHADVAPATRNQLNNKKLWQLAQPTLTSRDGTLIFSDSENKIQMCGPDGAPCAFDYFDDIIPDGTSVA